MTTKANCYICGCEVSKNQATRHLAKCMNEGKAKCMLIKVEDAWNKDYWIYFDMPINDTLYDLDDFLREIWLECCGHMSEFEPLSVVNQLDFEDENDEDESGISKDTKISKFREGDSLRYSYDFGSTTDLIITFVKHTTRHSIIKGVRMLLRNQAPTILCECCKKVPADNVLECRPMQFLCKACNKKHIKDNDGMTPLRITNSPRCGVCAYDGEQDVYEFSTTNLSPNMPGDSTQTAKAKKNSKSSKDKNDNLVTSEESLNSNPNEAKIIPFNNSSKQLELFSNTETEPDLDVPNLEELQQAFLQQAFNEFIEFKKNENKVNRPSSDESEIAQQSKILFMTQVFINFLGLYGILTKEQITSLLQKTFPNADIEKSDLKYLFICFTTFYSKKYKLYAHPSLFDEGTETTIVFELLIKAHKNQPLYQVNIAELISFKKDLLWQSEYFDKVVKLIKKYKIKFYNISDIAYTYEQIWLSIQTAKLFDRDPKEYIQKYILADKTGKLSAEYDDIIAHTRLWILNGRMPCEVDNN